LWIIYKKGYDYEGITEEALNDIEDELKEWKKEREKRWD
jgi:hypothetical protein